MTGKPVRITRQDGIALIEVDNPPVNALSQAVRAGLVDAANEMAVDPEIVGGVLHCGGRTFIAGADINEFGKPPMVPFLPDVIAAFESCGKPTVAAIHGTALGGGLEMALGCSWRVMAPTAQVGLPEVTLGIIPGAGGTQRLPRLIGIIAALEIIASGRRMKASEAVETGVADAVVDGDLVEGAVAFLRERIAAGEKPLPLSARAVPAEDAEAIENAANKIRARARGQLSPAKAVESVLNAAAMPFADAMAIERAAFLELLGTDQAKALRHVFFGERRVAKVPGQQDVVGHTVSRVGVVGAGTMGSGIAVAAVEAGFDVTVVETSEDAAARGRERIEGIFDGLVKRGRLGTDGKAERMARIAVEVGHEALGDADMVIEAVFEDMAVKKELVVALDRVVKPGTVIATNTSYLDINEIARVSAHPENICGMHFFSPANVMKLLEVVGGEATSDDTLLTALVVGRKMKKVAVVAGVCDGFIGNRIWAAWRRQAEFLLEDGALPQDIDAAITAFGFPMGPFAVYDLSGLDIAWAQRKRLAPTRDPRARYVGVPDTLCEAGRLGRKSGAGWYDYSSGKAAPDRIVTSLIEAARAEKGIAPRNFTAEEIQARMRATMVNEGAKILEEGIAMRTLDVDMVMIHGYGYPAWRGGPMFEADLVGLPSILAEVEEMCAAGGFGWKPAPLLVELATSGKSFTDWSKERG
ncbi:MAG: 3-hydroxyacyl-CoA dehydrogenase [Hyphomicrobiales bacterium]|nr:MAG: 3-hydroxyacyl-CoA dehydrogenase [Hyphomicrobiales bacterium]